MKKTKYTVRRYMGDDLYSWAVFKDLPENMPLIIDYGIAVPVVNGLSRHEALNEKRRMEARREK